MPAAAMHLCFTSPIHFHLNSRPHIHRRPVMTLQHTRITLRNEQCQNLVALLTSKASPPHPLNLNLTVLCHGFQDSKNSHFMTYLSENLPFPTVRIDFSGNGESDGTFRYANYHAEVSDLRALILHLRHLGARVTTILGHSKGADVVLLYASKYADVPNVINLAARYDMRRGVRERFGASNYKSLLEEGSIPVVSRRNGISFEYTVTSDDLQERFAIDMDRTAKAIPAHVKVLTVHGENDEIIPVADGHEIHNRVKNGRLVIVEGCGHSFRGFEQRVVKEIAEFIL